MKRAARLLGVALLISCGGAVPAVGAEHLLENFVWHDAPRELPEFTFQSGEQKILGLDAFRGKVVLLNVWATWCGPCRREMPTLDRLQARVGGSGFEVVALSIDRAGLPAVEKFYREIGIQHLRIYFDSTARASRALRVVGLPTTLLLDTRGREAGRLVGPAEWDSEEAADLIGRMMLATGGECDCPMGRQGGAKAKL